MSGGPPGPGRRANAYQDIFARPVPPSVQPSYPHERSPQGPPLSSYAPAYPPGQGSGPGRRVTSDRSSYGDGGGHRFYPQAELVYGQGGDSGYGAFPARAPLSNSYPASIAPGPPLNSHYVHASSSTGPYPPAQHSYANSPDLSNPRLPEFVPGADEFFGFDSSRQDSTAESFMGMGSQESSRLQYHSGTQEEMDGFEQYGYREFLFHSWQH